MADLVVPQLGESITEAVVAKWLKHAGDAVADGETVAELETDKVTVQLPSPTSGAMGEVRVQEGATVHVGDVIGTVEEKKDLGPRTSDLGQKGAPAAPRTRSPTEPGPVPVPVPAPAPVPVPAAARSTGSSSSSGSGNGSSSSVAIDRDALLKLTPSQRVTARETGSLPSGPVARGPSPVAPDPTDRLASVDPRDEITPMSPLRKRVAERLVQAQHESASLTTFNEVDMTAIVELRTRYKDSFEKTHGVKLGFMSFFVKACVAACKLFPGVNAEIIAGNIVYKKHYDFGIAVSTPKGLVVPVLRDCDARSFADVERGIIELATRARDGKLALPDLAGGTFTITNGGIYGSMMSTPLLNYPQTGILGMHNIVKRAVVIDDAVVVRPMMYVALSYDHRVVDGREAVSFLVAVKERLETPDRMLVGV